MALYREGITKCHVCGNLVYENQKRTGFTHFLDESDPLWKYSDAVFHYDCFINWVHKEEYLKKYRAAGFKWSPDDYEPQEARKNILQRILDIFRRP